MAVAAVNAPAERQVLKRDQFGSVCCLRSPSASGIALCVERDTTAAAWWIRWLARRLAAREARALAALERLPGLPRIEAWDGRVWRRFERGQRFRDL